MMIFLLLCMALFSILTYWELRKLRGIIPQNPQKPMPKEPPKARESFVVKRMEERLKEALYE